jgi:hypothetical protein
MESKRWKTLMRTRTMLAVTHFASLSLVSAHAQKMKTDGHPAEYYHSGPDPNNARASLMEIVSNQIKETRES